MRTSPGSAYPGKRRCGGNRSILLAIERWSRNCRHRAWSIRASKAAPRSRAWSHSARPRRHGRATPTARRSIRARRSLLSAEERARLIDSGAPYALRLDMAAARARAGESHLDRAGRRARRRNRRRGGPAGSLGRRHPGAQGDADQLPSLGRDRRCPAGRHRGGAGAGPVLVDERAPVAAGSARPARNRPTGITA